MNPVQQRLYDQIVGPSIRRSVGLRMAEIRDVDYVRKRATIAFTDSQNETGEDVTEVNIVRQNGLHESGPFPGDSVLIGFLNNNLKFPYIVGAADNHYADVRRVERDRHHEQGALLSDAYTKRKGETWNV